MKNISILVSSFLMLISCAQLKDFNQTFKDLDDNISRDLNRAVNDMDSLVAEVRPIEEFTKRAVMGVFDGAADPATQDDLDTLTRRMTEVITNYLNKSFDSLNVRVLGENFMAGVKDSLLNDNTKARLKDLINSASDRVAFKLDSTLRATIRSLNSPENQASIRKMLDSLLSDSNSIKLSNFLQKSIDSLNLKPLGDKIVTQLFSKQFQTRVDSLTASAIRAAEDAAAPTKSWIQRQLTWLIILIVLAAFIIILLRYIYKRKNLGNISNVMMAEIQAMESKEEFDKITSRIKQRAISMNVEEDLNRILRKHGLVDDANTNQSKRKWK